MKQSPAFITLLLLISFASVNAVLYTPALPAIAHYFGITANVAQQSMTWFLVGYAIGQLFYGPLANRYGRKPALYMGISLQIISNLICAFAVYDHYFSVLLIGRLFMALGAGVGLKMTFTIVNECYTAKVAQQKISYLMLAFAITPGLSVALGGWLTMHFGWISCFYVGAIYGLLLLMLVARLPETKLTLDLYALRIGKLMSAYAAQFKDLTLVLGGLLMGIATCFVYVFASLAPFIAMNLYGMSSVRYGSANIIPAIGLALGSVLSASLVKHYEVSRVILLGIAITALSLICMLLARSLHLSIYSVIFVPMAGIYFGLALVMANASVIAMRNAIDKAQASAVMSFINMGLATLVVLNLGVFKVSYALLVSVYIILCISMFLIINLLRLRTN